VAAFLTIDRLPVKNEVVLVRVDFNVPMEDGQVTDTTRLERSLPTLRDLAKAGARVVMLSHFGRPKGKPDPQYSLRPVAAAFSAIWGQSVAFAEDCVGPVARAAVDKLQPEQLLLLENTRFHPEDEANDPAFAKELASLGKFFVNDAFSVAHRAHASTTGIAQLLPSAAGRLMQEELEALSKALEKPAHPVMAIVGGSKISTKLDLLRNLIRKVDVLVPGGGMANTFLAASGLAVGTSLIEADMFETARAIMADAAARRCRILLPVDVVVADAIKPGVAAQTVAVSAIPPGKMILDLGPATVAAIDEALVMCSTVVWNGPLGVFEIPPFDAATTKISRDVAEMSNEGKLLSVAGGGDTIAALSHAHAMQDFSYVSTAGGAFLEWLEGKELPGVVALKKYAEKVDTTRKGLA
jgi:phosphoglycerate kinase